MKLETFFEKFELFADAPNAVAKMRELVLQLACSGRIADQVPSDQPGTELLAEIFSVRDRFIKESKGKNRVEGDMITAGDTMSIPSTWTRCMISEVCDLQTGATPSRQESTYFGGNIPWLVSGDVNRSEIFECVGRITDSGLRNSNCRVIPKNSVLIALNGQGKTRATVALLRMEATLNQSLVAMIPYSPERLLPEYLFWNLRGRYYAIRDITGQDQRRGLNMKLVGQLSLPVPPLAEQKRIVAKVDALMALCDRLEKQQQERVTRHAALAHASLARFAEDPTPANLSFLFHQSCPITPADLRKTILTLAVQGKIAPQDPSDEPASEHLKRSVVGESAIGGRRGVVEASGLPIAPGETPYELPVGWEWCRLSALVPSFQNGVSSRGDHYGTPVVVLRLADIGNQRINFESTRKLAIDPHQIAKYSLRQGDILITRVNGSADIVGRFVRVESDLNAIYCDHFIRMRIDSSVADAQYMELLGATELVRDQVSSLFITTAGQKTVNQGHVNSLLIALPPLAEQRRIVAKVDQLMASVDQLEARLAEAIAKSAALLDAVIHELLNPTAEIIDLAQYRAAVACYAIRKMRDKPYFGRTAAMKALYLAEAHVGLTLKFQPEREAAGPLDRWIYRFEEEGENRDWFKLVKSTTANGYTKVQYRPGAALSEQAAQAERLLTPEQRKELDRLLTLLADKTTEEAELIATLFAAWNDFLIDGHTPSDDEIVLEVREHWHEKKARFAPALLRQWLGWLRQNHLVPMGHLPHTVHQPQLQLN